MKICIIYLKIPISHTSFPVGKVEFMNMHPMTFSEFLLADNAKNLVDYMQSLEKVEKKPDIFFNQLEDIVNVISIIYFFNILPQKPNFINNKVYLITVVVGFAFKMIQPSFFSSGEILLSLCSLTVVPYFYNYYELSKNK